jgi:hypothetical protein
MRGGSSTARFASQEQPAILDFHDHLVDRSHAQRRPVDLIRDDDRLDIPQLEGPTLSRGIVIL